MQNTIIYLIGFPGTGKYTIAKELQRHNFKLVDNHLINNPIFSLIKTNEDTRFPNAVWDNIAKIRNAVLHTVEHLSPADYNFIFTNALLESLPGDREMFERMVKIAAARQATLVPVRLLCEADELAKRIASAERAALYKMTKPESAYHFSENDGVLNVSHPHLLNLDVTHLSAEQAAQQIIAHALSLI